MKVIWIGLLLLAVLTALLIWGRLHGLFYPGNAARYGLSSVEPLGENPLRGKTVFCLGSSVTAGLSSGRVSFPEYLEKRNGCHMIKEAVSASTLADKGRRSYLKRLTRHPAVKAPVDCFLCQLSTNDATFRSDLGEISDSMDPADFDRKTTIGGLESIIAFVKKTWDCPIVFFTGTRYDNPHYHRMVNELLELREKWDIEVIDLWHDDALNRISPEERKLYMVDGVHPTKAGYLRWWTPALEKGLYSIVNKRSRGAQK